MSSSCHSWPPPPLLLMLLLLTCHSVIGRPEQERERQRDRYQLIIKYRWRNGIAQIAAVVVVVVVAMVVVVVVMSTRIHLNTIFNQNLKWSLEKYETGQMRLGYFFLYFHLLFPTGDSVFSCFSYSAVRRLHRPPTEGSTCLHNNF